MKLNYNSDYDTCCSLPTIVEVKDYGSSEKVYFYIRKLPGKMHKHQNLIWQLFSL